MVDLGSISIYFEELHHGAPMLHAIRYRASVHLPQHLQPPMCLQYAVMALAAGTRDNFSQMAVVFYQRARQYSESDEMKVSCHLKYVI